MKKIIALLLVIALTAALSVSLTMAYLQDTDDDVNVMTLGNVYIEQHEYQRADKSEHTGLLEDGDLIKFEQGQPLYPAVPKDGSAYTAEPTALLYWGPYVTAESDSTTNGAGNGLWNDSKLSNVMDKMIFVENTGKSACYYRTIIAFECPEGMEYSQGADKEFMMNINGNSRFVWAYGDSQYYTIDGTRYLVMVATYQNPLAAGEISRPSLLQVVMTHNATNEDMELLGDSYEILALSQAVQTNGFVTAETALNTAFGTVNADNIKAWMENNTNLDVPTVTNVSTAEELTAAIAKGGIVVLEDDVVLSENTSIAIDAGKDTYLNLNGHTMTAKNTESKASCAINNKGTLTITNGTVTYNGVGDPSFGYGTNTINNTGKLIIDGATIINTTNSGSSVAIDCAAGAELIVNSGVITSAKNAIRLCPFSGAPINCTINGGTITGARAIQIQLPSNNPADAPDINLTINGGTLTGTSGLSLYSYSAGQSFANVDVTITGGIFMNDVAFGGGNAKTTKENVTITGGTFNGELGRYLANDGWEVIAKP